MRRSSDVVDFDKIDVQTETILLTVDRQGRPMYILSVATHCFFFSFLYEPNISVLSSFLNRNCS